MLQGCYGPQGTSIEYRMEVGGVVMDPTLAGGAPTVHLAGHILLKYPPPRFSGTAMLVRPGVGIAIVLNGCSSRYPVAADFDGFKPALSCPLS